MSRFKGLWAMSVLCAVSAVHGGVIVSDGFEYENQAAFTTVWPSIGTSATNPSGLLSTTQANGGTSSISIPGTANNNEYRNRLTFAETGGVAIVTTLTWSF